MSYLFQVELSGDRFRKVTGWQNLRPYPSLESRPLVLGKVLLQADTGEQVHICRAINIYKRTGKTMQKNMYTP